MAKGGQREQVGRMEAAYKLYDAGDVVKARHEARRILAENPTEAEAAAAKDLLARAGMPREGMMLAGVAAVMIVLFILLGILRG